MVGLLGKKVGMTQIFDEGGRQIPVTVLEVGPCYVTDLRTKEKDGYSSVQLGFGAVKEKRLTKPELGQFKKTKNPALYFVREIRTEEVEGLTVGGRVTVENFQAGDFVDIEGTSIGKGFQGVVKRLHYKGSASKSHGSMHGRVPGSIGSKAGGVGCRKKVRKGKGLPGHMGHERVTVQNLKVMKVDAEKNLLAIWGAVPGVEGGYLVVRKALKRGTPGKWKVQNSLQESSKENSGSPEGAEKKTAPEVAPTPQENKK